MQLQVEIDYTRRSLARVARYKARAIAKAQTPLILFVVDLRVVRIIIDLT